MVAQIGAPSHLGPLWGRSIFRRILAGGLAALSHRLIALTPSGSVSLAPQNLASARQLNRIREPTDK
jgi:hypothetical protein